jgi:hypothetical protein
MRVLVQVYVPIASIVPLGAELIDSLALLQLVVKSVILSTDGGNGKESSNSREDEEAHNWLWLL